MPQRSAHCASGVGELAHEIGTPLNVIPGNAQYLLRKSGPEDPARPGLQQVVKQAQRIAAMIRRLLDLSRPVAARLAPVDVGAVIRQAVEVVPAVAQKVVVRIDVDADTPSVLADPKLLEHALLNLILNACQAMPDGGRLAIVARQPAPWTRSSASTSWSCWNGSAETVPALPTPSASAAAPCTASCAPGGWRTTRNRA